MSKRILMLGASGFIGRYLLDRLKTEGHEVTGTYLERHQKGLVSLNLLDYDDLKKLLLEEKPEYVVFLTGSKDVRRCEQEPAYALDTNVQVVRNYILACSSLGLRPKTLFFSTDYVFDGVAGHYASTSLTCPRTVYGATNMIAERLFQKADLTTLILRVSAVMGRSGGFYHWLEENLLADNFVELYDNTYFSPTSIGRLCDFVAKFIKHGVDQGVSIAHLSDGFRMTRYDFGRLLAAKLNKPNNLVGSKMAVTGSDGFQYDLSLLPNGRNIFLNNENYDEFTRIF
jgi:dTDP-4-dehydrorhamnose reductase